MRLQIARLRRQIGTVWECFVVVLVYTAGIFTRLWHALLKNVNAVNAFGTLLIGVATIALVISTIMQWRAFVTSDERAWRAWLSPIALEITEVPGAGEQNRNHVQMSVDYQNTGREPALNVTFYASVKLFDAAAPKRLGDSLFTLTAADIPLLDENDSCENLLPLITGATAYPSAAARYQITTNVMPAEWSTIYEMTMWLKESKKILYVNGCFAYTTVEQTHYSKFCQFLFIEGGLLSATPFKHCPSGNWAD